VNITTFPHRPRGILPVAAVVAAVSAAIALPFAGEHSAQGHESATHAKQVSSKQLALHDGMRKLWEDHVTWTRLAIVSFAGDLPDFEPTAQRLLRNQVDIGNAIEPYYGKRAGNRLTSLLQEHISGAVVLLKAAKANDASGFADAKAAWYVNGDQIARFLNRANPGNWRFAKMRSLMRVHLDDTLVEAASRLKGDFRSDIRAYDKIHRHILMMADTLSQGIVKQFPARFR
jgi:hypothetical protein